MQWRSPILVVALFAAGVACGWLLRRDPVEPQQLSRTQTSGDTERVPQSRRLAEELGIVRRQVAEQQAIIREHALSDGAHSVEEMLALFPAPFPQGDWSPAEGTFEDCWFTAVDGVRLHGWWLPHAEPRAVLLHVHGNAGNITHRAAMAEFLHDEFGVSVLLFDYRGYGRSEGRPTIEGLIRDAEAARDYLAVREGMPPDSIVLHGTSLGGAIAVQLAADGGARGLILESTFSSLKEVSKAHYPELLVNLLVADRLDSATAIASYEGPLLQCHGAADRTIPFDQGEELFAAANEPKTWIAMPGLDHNDGPSKEYFTALEEFLSSLPPE
jgi:fermentation-respiration switch protein FrsA (DUF1100 family)